jgi:hypothetical protein
MKQTIVENDYYAAYVDKSRNRMYWTLRGFWKDVSVVPDYKIDNRKCLDMLLPGFTVLLDIRELKTPPADVIDLHMENLKAVENAGMKYQAQVLDQAILKIAGSRVLREAHMEEKMRQFNTIEEADSWLDSVDPKR